MGGAHPESHPTRHSSPISSLASTGLFSDVLYRLPPCRMEVSRRQACGLFVHYPLPQRWMAPMSELILNVTGVGTIHIRWRLPGDFQRGP